MKHRTLHMHCVGGSVEVADFAWEYENDDYADMVPRPGGWIKYSEKHTQREAFEKLRAFMIKNTEENIAAMQTRLQAFKEATLP